MYKLIKHKKRKTCLFYLKKYRNASLALRYIKRLLFVIFRALSAYPLSEQPAYDKFLSKKQ